MPVHQLLRAGCLGRLDGLPTDRAHGSDRAGDIGREHEGEDHGVEGRHPPVPQGEGGDGPAQRATVQVGRGGRRWGRGVRGDGHALTLRSEEHTSELQSRGHLVCRLLLEKKNKIKFTNAYLMNILFMLFDRYVEWICIDTDKL